MSAFINLLFVYNFHESNLIYYTPNRTTASSAQQQQQQQQNIYTQNVDLISHNFKVYNNKGYWISERTLSFKYQGAR